MLNASTPASLNSNPTLFFHLQISSTFLSTNFFSSQKFLFNSHPSSSFQPRRAKFPSSFASLHLLHYNNSLLLPHRQTAACCKMPSPPAFDYYEALEVDKSATIQDITSSYRRLALVNHTDKNPDNPDATSNFQKVSHPCPYITHKIQLLRSLIFLDCACLRNPQERAIPSNLRRQIRASIHSTTRPQSF